MTDDEAFIRAIVDNPGDDTTRLVYADWLDERDDPRGDYMRAEVEWATPWCSGMRAGMNLELREMAARLDSEWAARVSRPPVGVCCMHVGFVSERQRVASEELAQVERELNIALPASYRAFLLNYNGGRPIPATDADVGHSFPLEQFDSLAAAKAQASRPHLRWSRSSRVPPILEGCIPIGMANASGDAIYLRHARGKPGFVYIRRGYQRENENAERLEFLCMEFEALIARIRVR